MFWKVIRAIDWVIDALLFPVSYLVWRVRIWWAIRKLKKAFANTNAKLTVIELEVTIKRPK